DVPVVATLPAPPRDPVIGGRLVVAGEAEVGNSWTPAGVHCDSFCNMRIRTFLEPLFVTGDDLQVHPFLAERIEANVDSTVFTIKVREGITFSDGTPLDAAGVIANLDRAAASPLLSGAMKDLAKHPDGTLVVEQLDDHTFTLSTGKDGDPAAPQPWPLFPSLLTGQPGLIASPTWLAAVDGNPDLATQPIGTGPFVVSTFVPGDRMTVRRNPGYWRQDGNGTQLPYLDEIEFRVIVDPQAQAAALDAGDVDLIATADPGVVGTYAHSTDPVSLQQRSHGETDYVLFHLTQPQFQDQAVRCALVQAVDRQDLVDVVFGGVGDVASGPFSPDQDGYLDDAGLPVYDPAAASATIAEWEEANGPLAIDYTTTPTGTDQAIADYLQRAWGEVGVDVTSSPVEQSELISAALLGSPELVAARWRNHAGLSVDAQLPWWHGFAADGSGAQVTDGNVALNVGRLNDPVIDDLLDQARSEADPAARQALAQQINQRFAEQCWILPLSWTTWGIIMDPAVQNIGRTPLPDGAGTLLDGAGFPGQVWLTSAFVAG
ncbi:MAG: ABC transporter substrate-binding protein, partial [Ilumatobacteraceae bacterium]